MKYTNAKYIAAAVVTTSSIALTSMAGTCFAKDAPVYLTAPATPIDITISTGQHGIHTDTVEGENAVYINQTSDASNDATVTNIVITNNVKSAPISVNKIKVTSVENSGYTLVSYNTTFNTYAINSKKYALAINKKNGSNLDSTIDLVSEYNTNDPVAASGGTVTYGLTGKVSASSSAVSNAHIADVVVTVSE